jgi:hypothetical protein
VKTNFLTHTILASYNNVEPMKYIAGDLKLKPEYLALVGTPAFREQCGDYVIIGEQKGRWFFGTVQLSVKDTLTESKLAAGGAVDGQYGTFAAEVSANTVNKMKEAAKTEDLQIRVTSSGTNSASLTIDQFLAQVKAFPGANGPKQTYKLKAVPIESIVANWPANNPLAPLTAEQKLTRVAEAAWGLTALIADSDFVVQNAKLFAIGTTPAKRDARIAHIKARRGFYQAQLDACGAAPRAATSTGTARPPASRCTTSGRTTRISPSPSTTSSRPATCRTATRRATPSEAIQDKLKLAVMDTMGSSRTPRATARWAAVRCTSART